MNNFQYSRFKKHQNLEKKIAVKKIFEAAKLVAK